MRHAHARGDPNRTARDHVNESGYRETARDIGRNDSGKNNATTARLAFDVLSFAHRD